MTKAIIEILEIVSDDPPQDPPPAVPPPPPPPPPPPKYVGTLVNLQQDKNGYFVGYMDDKGNFREQDDRFPTSQEALNALTPIK